MILRIFKSSYIAQILFLISLTLILWLPTFLKPNPIAFTSSNVFTDFIFEIELLNNTSLSKIIGFLLLLTEAFILTFIFSKHQLTHRNSFLSGFLFVLFLSRTPNHLGLNPSLIALLLLLVSLYNMLESYKVSRPLNNLLSTSIIFSLAGFFVPAILYLFPIILLSQIIFQSFSWRSIPISLIGLFLPYLILGFAFFWFDKSAVFIEMLFKLLDNLIWKFKIPVTYELIELSVSIILLFLASAFILPRIGSQVISIRKKTSFMYWFLGISILISFFNTNNLSREIVFIPFAAILGFYLIAVKRKFWADLFISLVFLLIIFQNYKILFSA